MTAKRHLTSRNGYDLLQQIWRGIELDIVRKMRHKVLPTEKKEFRLKILQNVPNSANGDPDFWQGNYFSLIRSRNKGTVEIFNITRLQPNLT